MFKKRWRKLLAASLIVGTLTFAPVIYGVENFSAVYAEVKLYTAMGVDYGNEIESQEIVKLRARDKAIKNAVKQAGVYLKTYSRSVNSELTDDEITAITSNTYELVGEPKYNRVIKQVSDQITLIVWEVTVDVNVDDSEITKWVKRDDKDKSTIISQTREAQKVSEENDRKVEDLRKRANNITDEAERAQLKSEFEQVDKEFLYNQKNEEGVRLFYQSYYVEALNSFSEAIKINPNVAKAYANRFATYKRLGKLEAALEDLNQTIKLDPKNINYYISRAYLYKDLKQYSKALAEFNKIIELNPKKDDGYHGLATIYEKLNQKEKALEEYTRAINTNPNSAFEYYCRASLYKELRRYDKALADLTKMIDVALPNEIAYGRKNAYAARAELYKELKQYDKALDDLTECINVETDEKNKADAYYKRALFYSYPLNLPDKAATDYEKAIEFYTKAIASTNDTKTLSSCYYLRAGVYERLKQYDNAIADYTKRIELNKFRDALAYMYRAKLYAELKRYDEAIVDFSKVIELEPGNKNYIHEFGQLYEDLKQYDKAIEVYNKMIAINPKDTYGYLCRARAYKELKQYDKALNDYNKAIELEPYDSYNYYWRARCYEAMGETAKAQADMKKYEELEKR